MFTSSEHSYLLEPQSELYRAEDTELTRQRLQYASSTVPAFDGDVDFLVGAGALIGEGNAPREFTHTFTKPLATWQLNYVEIASPD